MHQNKVKWITEGKGKKRGWGIQSSKIEKKTINKNKKEGGKRKKQEIDGDKNNKEQ